MASEPKLVVAHFMVGNTYPYTLSDWVEDITIAKKYGLDGFALNVGPENWVFERISDCFDAVASIGTTFKLFISFDMSSFKSSCTEDIANLKMYIQKFSKHPNYLSIKGEALVSTFAGESSLFGQENLADAWKLVKADLSECGSVHLVPSFFVNPHVYQGLRCIDGAFHWNGAWPIHLTPLSPRREVYCPDLTTDKHHLHYLHGKTYMAGVSPWFFTHYGEDSWNKNWIYRGDDWLFVRRWEHLIAIRDQVDVVQVISWNDYGESHYIGPIKGAQPNSESWVNGFEHTSWLLLNAYFIHAFKTGQYVGIEEDRVFVWARPHLRHAIATDDAAGRPKNWQLTDEEFWVVVMTHMPATVLLWSDTESNATEHRIHAGLSKLQCPLIEGSMHIRIVRSGHTVLYFHPTHYRFQGNPETYNFNAFVATYPSPDLPF